MIEWGIKSIFALAYYVSINSSIVIENMYGNTLISSFLSTNGKALDAEFQPENFYFDYGREIASLSKGEEQDKCFIRLPGSKEPLNNNCFYLLVYDYWHPKSEILYTFRKGILSPNITAIPIDLAYVYILLQNNTLSAPIFPIRFSSKRQASFIPKMAYTILILFLAGLVHGGCLKLMGKYEHLEPSLSDFRIMNAEVLKYSGVENKTLLACSICYEDFADEDDVRMLSCKHYFHTACVDNWLIKHSRLCPYCREKITVEETIEG